MQKILILIKKIIPAKLFKKLQPIYHYLLASFSALIYFYPADKMIVIGVTGTTGKSSTCYFIAQILEQAGFKVGMSTTTLFKINTTEWLNNKKMTMPGRFFLQKLLKKMLKNNCEIAIIETTSEGIKQFRHLGVSYDILVFTNLYPEHIESHGSFEKYKEAKGKLFKYLHKTKRKTQLAKHKTIIANLDDEHAEYFLNFKADKKIGFTTNSQQQTINNKLNKIIYNKNFKINLLGEYNIYNVLAGVAVAEVLHIEENKINKIIKNLKPLPGRLEFVKNNLNLKILVDYAFEPKAVEKLYNIAKNILSTRDNKIIHVLGSCGGGRDKSRRPILGQLAAQNTDIVIVTNEDPYDEDPQEIIDQVALGVSECHSVQCQNTELYKILDRREAIKKALQIAQAGDLILITGKGAEQKMCLANGKMIDWDDRLVIKEELGKL
ncbi:MAG: UDP-N-acetylmuramyl-tripeptide synthetase [Patescibacteria group bacterium]